MLGGVLEKDDIAMGRGGGGGGRPRASSLQRWYGASIVLLHGRYTFEHAQPLIGAWFSFHELIMRPQTPVVLTGVALRYDVQLNPWGYKLTVPVIPPTPPHLYARLLSTSPARTGYVHVLCFKDGGSLRGSCIMAAAVSCNRNVRTSLRARLR